MFYDSKYWKASTIRRAGLCSKHFKEDDFTTPLKIKLKRTAIPLPYIKFTAVNSNVGDEMEIVEEEIHNKRSDLEMFPDFEENESCSESEKEELTLLKEEILPRTYASTKRINMQAIERITVSHDECTEKICSTQDAENLFVTKGHKSPKIYVSSKLKMHKDYVEMSMDDHASTSTQIEAMPIEECICELDLNVIRGPNSPKTYSAQALEFNEEDDVSEYQHIVPFIDTCPGMPEITMEMEETQACSTCLEVRVLRAENAKFQKQILSLTKDKKMLRHNNKLLRRKLTNMQQKRRTMNKLSKKEKKKDDINKLMEKYNCKKPAAQALVKLQFHTPRAPYSQDEKDLSKKLYFHSASAFRRLRKAGTNR